MGPLSYGKKEEAIFLGREFATHKDYSEDTAQKIDGEVSRIVSDGYEKAKGLLTEHIDILNRLAEELLEKEVLNTAEIDEIIGLTTAAEVEPEIEAKQEITDPAEIEEIVDLTATKANPEDTTA
jgi:cell division protease FtsH